MPAATTRCQLIEVTDLEYGKLRRLLDSIDAEVAESKDDEDTSIKDIVAHRAHWIDLYLGWYHRGLTGEEVHFPAEGYKWNELKRYNADLRASQVDLGWEQARERLQEANRRLGEFLAARDDEELYGGPMVGANNDWTAGRWAEAAGASHYRSAARYIRARRRELEDG